jgi:omega-amidase
MIVSVIPEILFATTFAVRSRRHMPFLARVLSAVFAAGLWFSPVRVEGAEGAWATTRLKVAVVQMAFAPTLEGNRDRIVSGVAAAAARGARVAVFREGALFARAGDSPAVVKESIAAVSRAAAMHRIYVILGDVNHSPALKKMVNWMRVFGPDGGEIFHYDKLYNHPRGAMPGVFSIDGVPCSGMICADRWLRGVEEIPIQQGAQISFELSNNFAFEWVGPLGWYWNVPRALRNNVWVVVANTGNRVAGVADESPEGPMVRHGHSAIVSPDGRIVTGADETATIIMAGIDPSRATREEAIARATHPVLREFWQAGLKLQQGEKLPAPQLAPLPSPETEVTLAVSQVSGDITKMVRAIRDARERKADLVAFPARAIAHTALRNSRSAYVVSRQRCPGLCDDRTRRIVDRVDRTRRRGGSPDARAPRRRP